MRVCLVWLEWPEKCFRVDAEALRALRGMVAKGTRVVRAKNEDEFLRALPRAAQVITWHFREEWFAHAPQLRVLATPAAGRELVPAKGPRGVKVHFGGFHGQIISETVLGFVLAWAHGFFRTGPLWPRERRADDCRGLKGTTAVVLGFGRIGRAIGARLEGFGVRTVGVTRHGVFDGSAAKTPRKGLRVPYARADYLVCALPADTGTDLLVDARMLKRLPPRAVVVNIGRGNCIDEAALLTALRRGEIAAAYLDVFRNEPTVLNPAAGKGKVAKDDLANLDARHLPPNLIRMPHASAFAPEYLRLCFEELKDEGLI